MSDEPEREYRLVIGWLGEEHPTPPVVDGELWPDAEIVKPEEEP